MSSLRLRASVALVLAAFTAACGDSGSTGPSFADSVSTADALDFADGAASTATYLAENLNFGMPSVGLSAAMAARVMNRPEVVAAQSRMRWVRPIDVAHLDVKALARPEGLQAAADGCTITARGTWDPPYGEPVDMNENGVPDDYFVEVDCEESEAFGGDTVVTYFMTQRVSFVEIEGSLWGMNVRVFATEGARDNHGNFEKVEVTQRADVDVRAGSAVTAQEFVIEFSERFDGEAFEEGFGERWGADFDPTGTIALGSDLPDGALTLDGRSYFYETEGPSASFEISTPTPLAYNASCAAIADNPPFTAGVLLGRLNGSSSSASFEVTFTACASFTVDVDGAYDEPIVVTAGR